MSVRLITPPAVEPVDLESLKRHLRVEHAEDDALILTLGRAAREFGEMYTRRAWITQTWERTLNSFASVIRLPFPPLLSVTSIKYVDAAGVTQTVAPAGYTVDQAGEFAHVYPSYQANWPLDLRAHPRGVAIRFVAGYGNTPETIAAPQSASVPGAGLAAVKLIVGDLYKNREESVVGNIINRVPFAARRLLDTMRVFGGEY